MLVEDQTLLGTVRIQNYVSRYIHQSMKEKQVEVLFKKIKRKIIGKVGRGATSDTQLRVIGNELLGRRFIGVYPQDKIPLGRTGLIIANTDTSNGPGVHWVAITLTPKTIYVYDSFARSTKQLMKILSKNAKHKQIKIVDSDRSDAEQRDESSLCGQLCLSWLCVVKQVGIRAALKV
jgi:hypothetical protein